MSHTINTSDVHGWRRFLYGLLYAVSVMGWFFCVAIIGVGIKIIISGFSNREVDNMQIEYPLVVGPVTIVVGLLCVLGNGYLRNKFKREGAEDLEDVLANR